MLIGPFNHCLDSSLTFAAVQLQTSLTSFVADFEAGRLKKYLQSATRHYSTTCLCVAQLQKN